MSVRVKGVEPQWSDLIGSDEAVFAFDIGGTDVKAAVVDNCGEAVMIERFATASTSELVVEQIAQWVREFHARSEVRPTRVGVVAPGLVDAEQGLVIRANNLGWRDVPLQSLLERALDLPVRIEHDVRTAGLAEFRVGAASQSSNAFVVVIGTGLAGALFIDGAPYSSAPSAGEFGHWMMRPDGPECVCGQRGHLEAIASASGIARNYSLAKGEQIHGAREVLERALRGESLAASIWDDAVSQLALALSYVIGLISPDVIVVGGGLARAGSSLFDPLRENVSRLMGEDAAPTAIVAAELGENAGLVGAALIAREWR